MTSAAMRESIDSDRNPWAMVVPNGVRAAACGSTWMNCRSSVDVGELIDPLLVDRQPAGDANLLADAVSYLFQRDDRHQPSDSSGPHRA